MRIDDLSWWILLILLFYLKIANFNRERLAESEWIESLLLRFEALFEEKLFWIFKLYIFAKYLVSSNKFYRFFEDLTLFRSKQWELSFTLHIDYTKLITWFRSFELSTSFGFSIKGSEKKIVLSCDMKNKLLLIYPNLSLGQLKRVLYIAWTILQIWFIYKCEKSKGMQLLRIKEKGFPFSL